MTETTNGTDPEPPPVGVCQKTNKLGLQCRREYNHVARCRFGEEKPRPARVREALPAAEPPRRRINLIVIGGEPDAREAVAHFVRWALEAMTRDVDSTFIDPPRGTVEAMTALEGYRVSIRNAGG